MEKLLNLSLAAQYDLIAEQGRTLNVNVTATYTDNSGSTTSFDFTPYSSATLQVKNQAGTIILSFSTTDSSIQLLSNGVFKLQKTAEEMDKPRAGQYDYDMYLTSVTHPKRNFLHGKINITHKISN